MAASMFQIGQILDNRYQLVEPLKMAGLRQTWRSIDLANQTACIVKLLGFDATLQWQDYEQFEREIKILKSLKGDRIPRYLADFSMEAEGKQGSVFVQEEISGASLQTLLNHHHRFSEAEIRQIAIELLQILVDLHGQFPPVLHLDIKPDNLILSPDRAVYLVDFGAARSGAMAIEDFPEKGSYGYVPLEQFGGQAVFASDLYAVGATLVHLLTGVCPADLPQHQYQIQFRLLVCIDDRFTNWLTKMLQPEVNQRFQTAKQALAALFAIESEMGSIASASESSQYQIRPAAAVSDRINILSLSDQLQVHIAKRGIHFADALWLGTGVLTSGVSALMLFSHVHPLLSLLCWIDSLPLFGIGLISALSEATLTVNATNNAANATNNAANRATPSMAVQWKCLGIPYRRIQQTSPIAAIDSATSGITIQTESQQYSIGQFSPPLSKAESEGLVREVREWMGGWVDG